MFPFSFIKPNVPAFDPATLALTGWWKPNYGGTPWVGTASTGSSGSRNLTEVDNAPSTGSAVNGLTPADFDGINDRLLTGALMSALFTAAAGSLAIVFNSDTAAADAGASAPYGNPPLLADTNGLFIVGFSTSGVRVGYYDGATWNSVAVACATGGWHVVFVRWNGTNLEVRLDGGSWSSVARANISDVTGQVRLGIYSTTLFFNGRQAEVMTQSSRWGDATVDSLWSYFQPKFAL